jgi:kanamycin nucleotidyltransferase
MTLVPAPLDHQTRLQIAHSIADQLTTHFGQKLVAIALYGSLAQATDAPYSDIEMHCVVDEPGLDASVEWSAGDWKAEINLNSVNGILKKATRVEINWPITHGAFVYCQPLYDPTNLFIHLRKTAISQPGFSYTKAMKQLIIEVIYELTGKIRNIGIQQEFSMLAYYTTGLARWGACLIGLDNRFIYPTGKTIFTSSLTLDNRPSGYDALCALVMSGALSDFAGALRACEDFWLGVNTWARQKGLRLTDDLGDLLAALGNS